MGKRFQFKSVVMAVAGAANVKIDYNEFGKGNGIMFAVFEEVAQEGQMKGMIKTLKKYNESDDSILKELIAEFNVSANEAQEYLDRYNRGTL